LFLECDIFHKKFIKNNSKKIGKIIGYSDLQQKEIRDFIYQSIDESLKEVGIDTQFGRL